MTENQITKLPDWEVVRGFDAEALDQLKSSAFNLARATGKSAFNVMEEAGYPVFKIFCDGRILPSDVTSKSAESDDSLIRLTASTNALDMVRDVMEETALVEMKAAAPGTTVFLNHSYNVPEDVFGSVVSAEIKERTLPHPTTKEPTLYKCLEYVVRGVDADENERGNRTLKMIRKGTVKLGASVTVLIVDKQTDGDMRRIKHVYYVETSIVSVPCNPLSWVHRAAKALNPETDNRSRSTLPTTPEKKAMETKEQNAPTGAPDVAQKGAFNDQFQQRTGSIYFLTSLLCDAVRQIYRKSENAGSGDSFDAAAALGTALDEFKGAVMERVLPTIQEKEMEFAWYSFFNANDGAEFALDMLRKSLDEIPADAETLAKAGARNSKTDMERIQKMHDHCCELGAKCMTSEKAAPVAEDGVTALLDHSDLEAKAASFQTELAQKSAEIAAKDAELEQIKQEAEKWKAASMTVGAMLTGLNARYEALAAQPVPRPSSAV